MLDKVIFFFFAGVAILSAGLMVTRRNAIHSAVFLITTLLATAGIFLQLRAEFIFIAQIILYVGGIMVLFIFVIMLVNLDVALHQMKFSRQKWVALLVTLALGAEVGVMLWASRGVPGQGFLLPNALCRQANYRRIRKRWRAACSMPTCCRLKSPASCCWWPWLGPW